MKLRLLLCTAVLLSLPIASHAEPRPAQELNQVVATHVAQPEQLLVPVALEQAGAPVAVPAPASSPSIGSKLIDFALEHWEYLLTALLSLPLVVTHLTDKRKRIAATAIYYGAHMAADADVEMAPGGAKATVEKVAEYLKQADAYLLAHGWRPLKDGELAAAQVNAVALIGKAKSSGDASQTPAPIPSP